MRAMRWWHVGVVATCAILAAIVIIAETLTPRVGAGLGVLALFLICWFAYGWRFETTPRAAVFIVVVCTVLAPLAVLASPTFTTLQAVIFPIVWSAMRSLRPAVVVNVVIALLIAAALFITLGGTAYALYQAVVIESLSLMFSLALGFWMTALGRQSAERARLIDELQATQSQLAALSMDAGITSERERLAREIHDTIAQDLTGLVLLAQGVSRKLAAGDTVAAAEQLTMLEDGARTALAETRALVASTATPSLDGDGIGAALDRLATRYERETAMTVTVRADVDTALDRDLEVVLLRCAQEGLANVRKHSGASMAAITLVANTSELSLRVSDNGSGFDPAEVHSGYGLSGMRDRLALVGGALELESGEEGTTLLVTLPAAAPSARTLPAVRA